MDFGDAFALLLLAVAGVVVLSKVASNPRIPLTWRLIARDLEGDLYQDIITGQLFRLAA
jgi:hypothetical protein